jgi:hypothetical protein
VINPAAAYVLSLDIDGTLETGDPPGPLSIEAVLQARTGGAIIGSCSDRTLTEQRMMWDSRQIAPEFVARKTELMGVRDTFPDAVAFVHVGDTDVDRRWARAAGFSFVDSHLLTDVGLLVDLAVWLALAEPRESTPNSSALAPSVTGDVSR